MIGPRRGGCTVSELPGQDVPNLPNLPEGRLQGLESFRQLIRDVARTAAAERWRECWLSDNNFDDWPLGESEVVASLNDWSRSGGRMVMLAQTYQGLVQAMPRFVRWRQAWDHRLDCRTISLDRGDVLPSALWAPGWMMQRLDRSRAVVVGTRSAQQRLLMRQGLDDLYRRSRPGFPSTILGL